MVPIRTLCLFAVAILNTVQGQNIQNPIVSISSGTSFGMCRGYCQQSVSLSVQPLQLVAVKAPNFVQKPFPPVRKQFPISSSEWTELLSLVNIEQFSKLDERIGCPDCADGGAEWIEITWTDGSKRVTFENGRTVDGIENLITKLRSFRTTYLPQL